ncbi:MAG: DUF4910 domain-containing protein [Anaerolineaceae bacterium]|nr:DUF4910 domain-containing protein [Anaerolineaceae bacterium]
MRGLVNEIGPRPAGSSAELQALQWIQTRLSGKAYCFTRQHFPFASLPIFLPYYTSAGLAFLFAALSLHGFPWLALGMPVLVGGLPDLHNWLGWILPKRIESENLIVLPEDCSIMEVDIFFCAHVDTARAIPGGYSSRLLNPLRMQIFPVMQRMALILALFGLVSLVGFQLGPGIIAGVVAVSVLVGMTLVGLDLWEQMGTHGKHTVGANDNASGVGVLLVLAELLSENQSSSLKIGFLFTGAEEAGLWGASAFARSLADSGLRTPLVCVDMVGAGSDLRIMAGAKSLRTVKTNREINEWLERADPLAVRHTALRRSSDFEAFTRAGIPAGWIESSGTKQSWLAYHTQRDQMDQIDPKMLQRAVTLLYRVVQHMEQGKRR